MEESKKDKLDLIFQKQLELQKFLNELDYTTVLPQDKIDKTVLCIVDELFEFLRETNYKYWRLEKQINLDNLKNEYVDIFKFVLNLGIHIGITPEELFIRFNRKTKINYLRVDEDEENENYI